MQFSNGERLIVVMLAEVMEAMGLNQEIDPTLVKSLTISNDGWAIERKYSGIFDSKVPEPEDVKETSDILWMWGIIESSISKLTGANASEAAGWYNGKFKGFDGNNDDHYGIAHTLIEELGEFSSFKGRGLNSHTQSSLPRYQTMYAKFDGYVQAGQAAPLSMDALRDLCS